ncbi:SCO family protein [Actinopolymorpha sp. NPDC004070]|uniref:SCO family protein n=1 Tax=Actinopolymorpha sp. NPDC004070 TaxID=3154548 RepID=UPI0033B7ABBD
MRLRLVTVRRIAGVLTALAVAVGCVAGCGGGADSSGRAGRTPDSRPAPQAARMVATGNTMDQSLPAAAASTPLTDQDGRHLTLGSLRGKVVVLAPLLTMCQETCPMTSENFHQAAQAALAAQAAKRSGSPGKVVFVELTVDPARDTVRRMHAYAKLYGALPNWLLVTGKPAQVTAMWKALGVTTEKVPTEEPVRDWLSGQKVEHPYDVHHQDVVVIVGQDGHLRWITVGRPDARGTRLPTSMQKFLDDEGRDNLAHPAAGGASSWTARDVEQAVAYVRGLDSDG